MCRSAHSCPVSSVTIGWWWEWGGDLAGSGGPRVHCPPPTHTAGPLPRVIRHPSWRGEAGLIRGRGVPGFADAGGAIKETPQHSWFWSIDGLSRPSADPFLRLQGVWPIMSRRGWPDPLLSVWPWGTPGCCRQSVEARTRGARRCPWFLGCVEGLMSVSTRIPHRLFHGGLAM